MRSIKGKKVTWIDIYKPVTEDIEKLAKIHKFHPIILDELTHASSRTHIEHYDDYLFLVYHFPEYDHATKTSRRSEIDILITKNTIITAHYDNSEQLNQLFDLFNKNTKEGDRVLATDTLLPTYHIFERAIAFSLRQLRHIEEDVTRVAEDIFAGNEEELLRTISYVKRNVLDYRMITRNHEKFFQALHESGLKFWGEKARVFLTDLANDHTPVHRNLDSYLETIESLENTNSQLLNARTNRIIKRFTVGAFLFSFPFFFAFYSAVPEFHHIFAATPLRFWTFFFLIIAIVSALWFVFKKRRII
jgi:magnesium transporter